MDVSNAEPPLAPRLEGLRTALAENIPIVGDKAQGRVELAAKSLNDLLVIYTNWMRRLVPPRLRRVSFANEFWTAAAEQHRAAIEAIATEVERGNDLLPFLSERAVCNGYAPARKGKARRGIDWSDKDFALNVWGLHHLHLGGLRADGTISRTSDLLYVEFSREHAVFVLLGDHKSFDDGSVEKAVLRHRAARDALTLKNVSGLSRHYTPAERVKLARYGITTIAQVEDRFVISGWASTAGTSVDASRIAGRMYETLLAHDPKLDDKAYLESLAANAGSTASDGEWRWVLAHCDVCFGQEETGPIFLVLQGPL